MCQESMHAKSRSTSNAGSVYYHAKRGNNLVGFVKLVGVKVLFETRCQATVTRE